MLDPHLLRENLDEVTISLAKRGFKLDAAYFQRLEEQRKKLQVLTQALQNERNVCSKEIGFCKARNEDVTDLLVKVSKISTKLEDCKSDLNHVLQQLDELCLTFPNIPHVSVPEGRDERDNLVVRTNGNPSVFDFEVKAHDVLGEALGQMDFELATKITGSRFVVMRGQIAALHRALIHWMLDVHTQEHGYQEIYVPYIVNSSSLLGTGQLPKFEADLFKLAGDDGYYLTSTAEIPVTNTVRAQILSEEALPVRLVCHTPCFRSEAGSYGKDTKGMIRQHQFEKVELVWIAHPERSYDALESLTQHAESILQRLKLPYRVLSLCTGDIGASAAKTYDIEVWLPSQQKYREISSCSNMEAFQARRLQARYRGKNAKHTEWVHTLNGSGLAVGRTLVALMENYQDRQGNIHVPEVLVPYMHGLELLTKLS
jgi:seryl-tRNA synthetase